MKFCKKCQAETDRNAGGACKICDKAYSAAYRQAHPDKTKAYNNKWYRDNKDRVMATNSEWRKANPDKAKAHNDAWRKANPDKVRAYTAVWRKNNPDIIKASQSAWQKANPEKIRVYHHIRRARVLNAKGTHTSDDIRAILVLQNRKCACCKASIKEGYHIDHIMPLSKGGNNDRLNIQLLCAPCNLQKNAKHPIDFMQQKGFLL